MQLKISIHAEEITVLLKELPSPARCHFVTLIRRTRHRPPNSDIANAMCNVANNSDRKDIFTAEDKLYRRLFWIVSSMPCG